MTRIRVVLQPEYIKEFTCIGSECEDSCCIGWKVNLDKKTYLKYKKINNQELKPIIQKNVNRNRNQEKDSFYGKINMGKDGRCPFLNQDNLCKIYIEIGEEYLSDTCTLYPRFERTINSQIERCTTVSCPEIARLALLNKEGIRFEHIEEDLNNRIKIHNNLETEENPFNNGAKRYFWDIRIFSLELLQNRNYNLGERLIILGLFYKKIEELYDDKNIQYIPTMLDNMKNMIETGDLKDSLDKVPINNQIQMRLAKQMTDEKIVKGILSERYLECVNETLSGIGYIEGADIRDVLERYKKNYNEYLRPYLEEKEYILENFLVNEFFKEMMPFGAETIWDSYIFLCIMYSMVKMHLIGMAGYHEGLNDDLTLKLIQSFSKVVLHNSQYIHQMIKLLKDNEIDSLAYMSILVKN